MKGNILIQPIITEKSVNMVNSLNKYCFKVAIRVNRIQIKSAVEEKFKVKVVDVKTLNKRAKKVRFGKNRVQGAKQAWKKAVVTLDKKDKIDLFDIK